MKNLMKNLNDFDKAILFMLLSILGFFGGITSASIFITHSGSWKYTLPLTLATIIGLTIQFLLIRRRTKIKIIGKPVKGITISMSNKPDKNGLLNSKQFEGALDYYKRHKEHVEKMMMETDKSYEPSQIDDKNDPSIWKPEYWRWFFNV